MLNIPKRGKEANSTLTNFNYNFTTTYLKAAQMNFIGKYMYK